MSSACPAGVKAGSFTNTDAAYLAEYLLTHQHGGAVQTKVVGVPGSIDGDLCNQFIQTTFGTSQRPWRR